MLNSEELINKVKVYNKFLNPEKLNKAYDFAVKAHSHQKRASGDPYSVHPIEVANILTELKLDSATITTGLLHDTIEDTYATYETIKGEFGDEVADLVDGVTKISVLENTATSNSKAENFRKLILATSKDIRVLLVKIADRLHNMRTIKAISKECFIPITVGGGIKSIDDIILLLTNGADRVSINSFAYKDIQFISKAAKKFGSSTISFEINSDLNLTANFIKKKYELTIEVEGKGSVFQEIIKPGIADEYNSGTILKLTALPVDGWVFVEWQGDIQDENNPIEVTIDKPITIKAVFKHYPASGLPVVKIKTNQVVGPAMDKSSYVEGSLEIIGDGNFEGLEETTMKIKGRGNSTWWICTDASAGAVVGKCPYQVKFGDKTSILGMPEDKKWVLLAEKSDKSMIRNKIARYMGELSDLEYTPNAEYVELFINEDYQGTYLIGQKVEESSNRVDIGDDGYLIEIDTDANGRIDVDDIIFKPTIWSSIHTDGVFNIKDPDIDYGSDEFYLIENYINDFESVLYSNNFNNPDSGYESYIDVDSLIDWFLINEIAKTVDARWYSSIYFSYIPGEKIKMGPIWDFDLSYGNLNYSDAQYTSEFYIKQNNWIDRLFLDEVFVEKVKIRYSYYYNKLDDIKSKIDEFAKYIDKSQKANFERWDILGVYVWPNPVYDLTYEEEVERLKNWIEERMNWLNSNF